MTSAIPMHLHFHRCATCGALFPCIEPDCAGDESGWACSLRCAEGEPLELGRMDEEAWA